MDWLWTFLPPKPSTGVGLGGPRSVTVLGNTQRPVVPIVSGSQPQGLGTVPGLEPIPFDTSPLALFTEEGRGRVGFHPGAPLLLSTPLLESPTITLFCRPPPCCAQHALYPHPHSEGPHRASPIVQRSEPSKVAILRIHLDTVLLTPRMHRGLLGCCGPSPHVCFPPVPGRSSAPVTTD